MPTIHGYARNDDLSAEVSFTFNISMGNEPTDAQYIEVVDAILALDFVNDYLTDGGHTATASDISVTGLARDITYPPVP